MRITEINFDGQSFKAPELAKKQPKPKKVVATDEHEPEHKTSTSHAKKGHAKKKVAPKKAAAKKTSPKKKK